MAQFHRNFTDFMAKLGAFYLFIADFFATQILGGAKELVCPFVI